MASSRAMARRLVQAIAGTAVLAVEIPRRTTLTILPVRFRVPPEISLLTLRAGPARSASLATTLESAAR